MLPIETNESLLLDSVKPSSRDLLIIVELRNLPLLNYESFPLIESKTLLYKLHNPIIKV
jgi:hypothetical protein